MRACKKGAGKQKADTCITMRYCPVYHGASSIAAPSCNILWIFMHYSVDYVPAGVCTAASRYPYCRLYDNGGNPSNVCPASDYHVLLYGFCPCPSAAVYAVIGIVDFFVSTATVCRRYSCSGCGESVSAAV